jgi:hypothetical protein
MGFFASKLALAGKLRYQEHAYAALSYFLHISPTSAGPGAAGG